MIYPIHDSTGRRIGWKVPGHCRIWRTKRAAEACLRRMKKGGRG